MAASSSDLASHDHDRKGRRHSGRNLKKKKPHHRKHRHHRHSVSSSDLSPSASFSSSDSDSNSHSLHGHDRWKRHHGKRKCRSEPNSDSENESCDSAYNKRKKLRKDGSKKSGGDKSKEKDSKRKHEKDLKEKHYKHKRTEIKDNGGPVQLSKFLGENKDNGVRRSAVSGKKILMKIEKTKEDRLAENNRNELLKFLNASYD